MSDREFVAVLLLIGILILPIIVPTFHRRFKNWRDEREFNKATKQSKIVRRK